MSIRILRSGLLSTIQDLGRYGFQKYGVIVSGAMDSFALRIANLLVGNHENSPAIEMTLIGSTILFKEDSLIAICGAHLSPTINGQAIPQWRPVYVKKNAILKFGQYMKGCRAYLAVAGSFDLPKIMGSQSTYLRANMGGFAGRSLKENDVLNFTVPSQQAINLMQQLSIQIGKRQFTATKWFIGGSILPTYQNNPIIRIITGSQFAYLTEESKQKLFTKNFKITTQSDRMGYRLEGAKLKTSEHLEMISEAVSTGTIQVPPDGNPIILLSDRQTTGGYPKIAQVAAIDLPVVAQAKPGEKIHFQEISLEKAQELYLRREKEIEQLKQAIANRRFL